MEGAHIATILVYLHTQRKYCSLAANSSTAVSKAGSSSMRVPQRNEVAVLPFLVPLPPTLRVLFAGGRGHSNFDQAAVIIFVQKHRDGEQAQDSVPCCKSSWKSLTGNACNVPVFCFSVLPRCGMSRISWGQKASFQLDMLDVSPEVMTRVKPKARSTYGRGH